MHSIFGHSTIQKNHGIILLLLGWMLLPLSLLHSEECYSSCLTLQMCWQIALEDNPRLWMAEERVQMASAAIGVERAALYPNLRFATNLSRWRRHLFLPDTGVFTTLPTTVGPLNDNNIHVMSRYTIYDSGKTTANIDSASAQERRAIDERSQLQQDILLNVAMAFYQLAASIENERVTTQLVERTEQELKNIEERYNVGDIPLADLLRMRVELADAQQRQMHAVSKKQIYQGQLNVAMGRPPEISVCIDIKEFCIKMPDDNDLETAQLWALGHRPELLAIQQKVNALYHAMLAIDSDSKPKIYAEADYGHHDSVFLPQDQEWLVGVNLEIPLFEGFAPWYRTRKARADFDQAKAEWQATSLAVQQDVWKAYAQLEESYGLIERTEQQVNYAKESLRLTGERYHVGSSTLTDWLNTSTSFLKAEVDDINARWSYRIDYLAFLWAQGALCWGEEEDADIEDMATTQFVGECREPLGNRCLRRGQGATLKRDEKSADHAGDNPRDCTPSEMEEF